MKRKIAEVLLILLMASITILVSGCDSKNSSVIQSSTDRLIENDNFSSNIRTQDEGQSNNFIESADGEIDEEKTEKNDNITLEDLENALPPEEAFLGNYYDDMFLLLGKDEATDTLIYSNGTGNIILRNGDEIYVLEDCLGGPQYIEPSFGFYDYDGDGDIEFALSTMRDVGSSCLKTELSMYEKKNGIYERCSPDYKAFIEEATLYYAIQTKDNGTYMLGDIYETEVAGTAIEVTFHVGRVEEDKVLPEYDEGKLVKAEIIYNTDGSFVLSNIHLSQ